MRARLFARECVPGRVLSSRTEGGLTNALSNRLRPSVVSVRACLPGGVRVRAACVPACVRASVRVAGARVWVR
eukprot:9658601-Alexandrium_andersonii.AAC.1